MTRDGRPAADEMSPHEAVSRYTARIERLFEERGGRGAGLMQKAEPFNFALSERSWDDLCWLNSEGREVAGYDLSRFRRVAESVIAAIAQLPRLPDASAPARPASNAPPPRVIRPRSARPKSVNRARSKPESPAPRSRVGVGLLKLMFVAGLAWLLWLERGDLLVFIRDALQGFPTTRNAPTPAPVVSSLVDLSPMPVPAEAEPSARKKPKPSLSQPRGASAKPPGAREQEKGSARAAQTGAPHPDEAESKPAPDPVPAPQAEVPAPTPRPSRDPAIRMTPKELQSF